MKRSRSALSLIELCIMLLVLALASALCLRAFFWADGTDKEAAALDGAVVCAQNAAETAKHFRGQLDSAPDFAASGDAGGWTVYYDENWQRCSSGGAYVLRVEPAEAPPLCGKVQISVSHIDGGEIFSIPAAWQEVGQ